MALHAYVRVSTAQQDAENQRFEILKWADEHKHRIESWTVETISGTKSYKDRQLGELLETCSKGDTIISTEISRLARSLLEVMTILKFCVDHGIRVVTIKEKFELTNDIQSKTLSFAFSLSAEIERMMISNRTKEALARKKALGVPLGRPRGSLGKSKLDGKEQVIQELLDKKVSKASICKIVGPIHPGTLDAFIITRKLRTGKESNSECQKQTSN